MILRNTRTGLLVAVLAISASSIAWGKSVVPLNADAARLEVSAALSNGLPIRPRMSDALAHPTVNWMASLRQELLTTVASDLYPSEAQQTSQIREELRRAVASALENTEQHILLAAFSRAGQIFEADGNRSRHERSAAFAEAVDLISAHAGQPDWSEIENNELRVKLDGIEDVDELRTVVESLMIVAKRDTR